mgnify:CR=1 FL=1
MQSPGTQLETLCHGAEQQLLLVAPFIKLGAFKRLISELSDNVSLMCVTRWRPDEIVAGVSDIEIWQIIKSRPNSSLWLRSNLHAKVYRADTSCLVGSANLTDTALGWSRQPNFEFLLEVASDHPDVKSFEDNLMVGCVQVDESIYIHMKTVVEAFEDTMPMAVTTPQTVEFPVELPKHETWLPKLRHPENLFVGYSGKWDQLSSTSATAVYSDLAALEVPLGLSKLDFERYVGAMLLQKPIVRQVDDFVAITQRFGAVTNLLQQLPCSDASDFSPNEAWQSLMRWLLYFLPNRYRVFKPRHSEVFHKIPN